MRRRRGVAAGKQSISWVYAGLFCVIVIVLSFFFAELMAQPTSALIAVSIKNSRLAVTILVVEKWK